MKLLKAAGLATLTMAAVCLLTAGLVLAPGPMLALIVFASLTALFYDFQNS